MAVSGCCSFTNYVPPVIPFTDSIGYGIGCATLAGWREPAYLAAQAAGQPFRFVGTQSNAGFGGGMAADPFCESYPGIDCPSLNTLLTNAPQFNPRIYLYACGINDVIAGASASTIVGRIQTGATTLNGLNGFGNYRIVICPILKTLDAGNDVVVQAVNALLPAMIAGLSFSSKVIYDPGIYDCIPNPTVGVNMHDTVHPNDVGATFMGNRIYTYSIAPAVPVCRGVT